MLIYDYVGTKFLIRTLWWTVTYSGTMKIRKVDVKKWVSQLEEVPTLSFLFSFLHVIGWMQTISHMTVFSRKSSHNPSKKRDEIPTIIITKSRHHSHPTTSYRENNKDDRTFYKTERPRFHILIKCRLNTSDGYLSLANSEFNTFEHTAEWQKTRFGRKPIRKDRPCSTNWAIVCSFDTWTQF